MKTGLDSKGLSTQLVLNRDEIAERFQLHRDALKKHYASKTLDRVLTKFAYCLQHPIYVHDILRKDSFCNLLFHPKMLGYRQGEEIAVRLLLSLVPYSRPLLFKGTQTLVETFNEYAAHVIRFESEVLPAAAYFLPKNVDLEQRYYMQLDVLFALDIYHLFAMHTKATFLLFTIDKEGRRTVCKRIEYSQYEQDIKYKNLGIYNKEESFLMDEADACEAHKSKGGLWNFFSG